MRRWRVNPKLTSLNCMSLGALNPSELNKLLDMIDALTRSQSMEQFKQVVHTFQDFIGCEQLIFGVPGESSANDTAVNDLNISYPQEWVDLYQSKEFWRIDPIVRAAMKQNGPQHWADIYLRYPPGKNFLSLAHDFGLVDGCTCLTKGRIDPNWTIISMGGNFSKMTAIVDYVLDRLSPHFHFAICELRKAGGITKFKKLTKRELEVLKWLLHGKTSWEIAIILNVSEATINFHVANIKNKLNVLTRSQAVATAIHHRLIDL